MLQSPFQRFFKWELLIGIPSRNTSKDKHQEVPTSEISLEFDTLQTEYEELMAITHLIEVRCNSKLARKRWWWFILLDLKGRWIWFLSSVAEIIKAVLLILCISGSTVIVPSRKQIKCTSQVLEMVARDYSSRSSSSSGNFTESATKDVICTTQ
ncbi:hypothetical protein OIU78_012568 [Salix suchowensis]|nr:hypothetical protein OIU78_012568 [Salix suchowensis]